MASNAVAPKEKPLGFMQKLSDLALIYEPSTTTPVPSTNNTNSKAPPPKVIVVASWLDARDVHIAKYVARYQAMFPAATILVTKCHVWHMVTPDDVLKKLYPAAQAIRAAGLNTDASKPPELLVHVFSNGGSLELYHLYRAYAKVAAATGEDAVLPPHVTVFDSAPGRFSWERVTVAFNIGLSAPLRVLLWPAIQGYILYYWLQYFPWGRPDWYEFVGASHNDPAIVRETRRTYIYSEVDPLVDWRAVEAWAAEAEQKGFKVRMEKFVGSSHVAHAKQEPDRYWKIVEETWQG